MSIQGLLKMSFTNRGSTLPLLDNIACRKSYSIIIVTRSNTSMAITVIGWTRDVFFDFDNEYHISCPLHKVPLAWVCCPGVLLHKNNPISWWFPCGKRPFVYRNNWCTHFADNLLCCRRAETEVAMNMEEKALGKWKFVLSITAWFPLCENAKNTKTNLRHMVLYCDFSKCKQGTLRKPLC